MNKFYLLLLCCVVLFKANSQPGSLDRTFGNNGIQTSAFTNNLNTINESVSVVLTSNDGNVFDVVQYGDNEIYTTVVGKYFPDGRLDSSYGNVGFSSIANLYVTSAVIQGNKILIAGSTSDPALNFHNFTLARYTADGKLDSSFGDNGIVTTDFGSFVENAISITLQGDKIIAGGSDFNATNKTTDFALLRYTTDGILDSSFGVNGIVTTNFQKKSEDNATSIALQGGKIVLGGYTTDYPYTSSSSDFALARYSANGILDSSFGVNGLIITDFNKSDDRANAIALQGNKIIAGGYAHNFANNTADFALVRYTADGKLDSSFGVNGKATTDLENPDNVYIYDVVANSLALQGDNIIVGGYTPNRNGDNVDFALTRFTVDGKLDPSFGDNGIVRTDFNGSNNRAYSIALQGDNILEGGFSNGDFALARYTADGRLDASFGDNGLITGYFPVEQTFFTSTAIQGDKIIAAGYTYQENEDVDFDFALTRFTADGAVDHSFGIKGIVTTHFDDGGGVNAIALQGDKIIAVGYTGGVDIKDFALVRYTTDGVLDSSFGVNGKVITDFYNADNNAKAIAIQGDKILVAGSNAYFDEYPDLALARYTKDGKLDSSFGVNGKVIDTLNVYGSGASSIVLQGDKIIVAGSALARYTADGRLDSSFGVNGKVKATISGVDFATAAVLQGDKLIMAGYEYNSVGDAGDFSLTRYTVNGALDTTFGENGRVTDLNDYYITSIALQNDKIIVGGYTGNNSFYEPFDFVLVRYTKDGILDSSFGVNGKEISHLGGSSFLQAITLLQNRLYAVGTLSSLGFYGTGTNQGIIAAYQLEAPEPSISIADVTVSESKRLAVVTVRLSAPTNKLVRVHFTTRNKTAIRNQDYIPINGPLLFIPGVNNTAKIFIPILNDAKSETTEQFEILLTNAHNASIQDSVGVITIADDDAALIAEQSTSIHIITSPNPSANTFTVKIQSSNLKQPVSVQVYDMGGRLIEESNNISIGQSLRLGDQYKPGTYLIEAVQGNQKVQTKVIKAGK